MKPRTEKFTIALLSILLLLSVSLSGSGSAIAGDLPAVPESSESQQASFNPDFYETDLINVVFADELRIRLRSGNLVDLDNQYLKSSTAQATLGVISAGTITPTFSANEGLLDRQREQAEKVSGQTLPDLNNSFRVELPDGVSVEEAIALFSQMEEVVAAFPVPKPVQPPAPPDYNPPDDGNFDTPLVLFSRQSQFSHWFRIVAEIQQ